MKTLEQVISVFDPKDIRSATSIYNCLSRNGFTVLDLSLYLGKEKEKNRLAVVEWEQRVMETEERWKKAAPLCPDCVGSLNPPRHICKKKGPENIKGWTCLWYCTNGDCTYEKYTYENAGEEMKKLMENGRKG